MPSTVIRRFAYDPDTGRLVIEFLSGRRYAYYDVPLHVYEQLCKARSRGSCFNRSIRDHYPFTMLDDAVAPAHNRPGNG